MVAKQLRTVFQGDTRLRTVLAGGVSPQIRFVLEVWVVASNYPDEGRAASEDGDPWPELPFRTGGMNHPAHTEARAELRDRETYYAELRLAVHCQSQSNRSTSSIPAPRAAFDDQGPDAWTAPAHGESCGDSESSVQGESWDDMTARFGDTWT
jgi:hypothetical protein